jgi:multiple sugar transport system permease protein
MAKSLTTLTGAGQPAAGTTAPARAGANTKLLRNSLSATFVTGLALALLCIYLAPFLYMIFTSLKTQGQISQLGSPIWPAQPQTFEYNGKNVDVFLVPMNTCAGFENESGTRALAIARKGLRASLFVDPANLEGGEFECAVSWRALPRDWSWSPAWENYRIVWDTIDFPRLMFNTGLYAFVTGFGTLVSCTLVAYGFSRFRFPGRDVLFMVIIATIFLPATVTVIPTYTFFVRIGWVGTWLPLMVPHFFANAYNVFLLRQFFMTLPRELDESAMIDGAGPFRILWSVILPQSLPVLVAVSLFHIVFAWNDYFGPLIYLSTARDKWPISVALSNFNGIYGSEPQLIQAGALMALLLPVLLFFAAQRFFIQGIVITGVDK